MKITIITGSPRKHGNSNHLADQFIKGAEEAGHQIFRFNAIYLPINQTGKKAVLLLTQNNTDEHVSDPIKLEFEHIVDFLGWKNSGELVATGVGPVGAVNNTDFSKRAYEMGHKI